MTVALQYSLKSGSLIPLTLFFLHIALAVEFPVWHSGLRIRHCLCGSEGLIPGPVHWVKDPGLTLLRCRSQLWLGFDFWPWNFHMPYATQIALALQGLLCFYTSLKMIFSSSVKSAICILLGIALNLWVALNSAVRPLFFLIVLFIKS